MTKPFPILVAEDNENDALFLARALERVGLQGSVHFVRDGAEAIAYLEGQGAYADRGRFPFPKVIVSDLKMPRINGLELLEWLSDHPECCVIPTILLSGLALSQDIAAAYKLGANTYFAKPGTFDGLIELIRNLNEYWTRSELPTVSGHQA